jgi:tRNA pseudouridine38-40 synthase
MARYQVTLAYDGTHFRGFQRQSDVRTVQSEFEAALERIGWADSSILAAGRTDTGVHASGQIVTFDLDWTHSTESLCKALNGNLPPDMAVRDVKQTSDDFHPRYDARVRSYIYHIYCEPERNPLRDRYAWRVWPAVDMQSLNHAAQLLCGEYDFSAFGTPPRPESSPIRVVYQANWQGDLQQGLQYQVSANAFLYHMVRRMVYLQVLVGQNRMSIQQFEKAVKEAQLQQPGLAPSRGLVLSEVRYALNPQEYQLLERVNSRYLEKISEIGEDDRGKNLRH